MLFTTLLGSYFIDIIPYCGALKKYCGITGDEKYPIWSFFLPIQRSKSMWTNFSVHCHNPNWYTSIQLPNWWIKSNLNMDVRCHPFSMSNWSRNTSSPIQKLVTAWWMTTVTQYRQHDYHNGTVLLYIRNRHSLHFVFSTVVLVLPSHWLSFGIRITPHHVTSTITTHLVDHTTQYSALIHSMLAVVGPFNTNRSATLLHG